MRQEIEVMQIFRLPPMGKLVVSVNNKRYENLSEITEPKVKRLLQAAIGELIVFAGGYQELVDAGVAPHLSTQPQETEAESQSPSELLERQQKFLSRLEAERDAIKSTPPPKPQFPILSGIRPTIVNDEAEPGTGINKTLSLVEQIDKILQKHLASEPELAGRSIHLVQGAKSGLQILVDGTYYQKPRDIPEKHIQLMIKRALKEWETL